MSAEQFFLSQTHLDRLIIVWLQMHDVLLPALCVARDDGPDDTLPFGRPLEDGRYLRSDFGLCAPEEETPLVCIEVMGMLGSDRICRTDVEKASLDRLAEKQDWFSQPDHPLLRVIWLDMMAHPDWLEAICTEAIEAAVAQIACGRKKFAEVKERMPGRNFRQEKQSSLPASRWRVREREKGGLSSCSLPDEGLVTA